MAYDFNATDGALQQELGHRLAQARIARGRTQAQLARQAGVSKSTLERLEAGHNTQLHNLLRVLRALEMLDNLETLVPDESVRPMDLLKLNKRRMRASGKHRPATSDSGWQWGDETEDAS